MRKFSFKNIILSGLALLVLSACNDLDQLPKDKFTDESYWISVTNSDMVVNMAYNNMYKAERMWNDEALSDNLFNGRGWGDIRVIRNGLANPTNSLFAKEWKEMYDGLKYCHKYLDNVERVPNMNEDFRNKRIAEVKFIRAWIFFRLVNFYGDIPFFTTDILLEDSKTISRTPKATVMQFIHDELDDIMLYLPTRDELPASDNGRITKGAACALQARAYLYESNWPKVQEYTNRLINDQSNYGTYGLFRSYEGLFWSANEYNEEVIFDYAYVPELRRWEEMYHRAPISQGANLNASAPTKELVDSYITINGNTIETDPDYDVNNPYEDRDPRLYYTVVYDGFEWGNKGNTTIIQINPNSNSEDAYGTENGTPTGYYIRKYWDPDHEADLKQSTNLILLRYADVLLMHAEAVFEQNNMSEEVWNLTIRKIRERAGFSKDSALDYPTINTDDMRKLIRNERRSELAMEGLRYYDIVRWKAGNQYLNSTMHGDKFANNGADYISLDTYKFNENKDYLWSVPQSQLDMNPNLRPNNPGY